MGTKLVQITDVDEGFALWKTGLLLACDGDPWTPFEHWIQDWYGSPEKVVREALNNERGGWVYVED